MPARPVSGPRTALWEVILDGRSVTIAYSEIGHVGALAQGREALAAGRAAQVLRFEFCPACGTSSGQVQVRRRGHMFPVVVACRAHVEPYVIDELQLTSSADSPTVGT